MSADLLLGPAPAYDLVVVDGQLQLTASEAQLIAQRLAIRLLTWRGEWFANALYGMDYLSNVLGAPRDETLLAEAFRPALAAELDTIVSLTAAISARGLTLSFSGYANGLAVTGSVGVVTADEVAPFGLVVTGIQVVVNGVPVVVSP